MKTSRAFLIFGLLVLVSTSAGCLAKQTRGALDEAKVWIQENKDQLVKDAQDAATAYVEAKLIEQDKKNYQEALIFAEDNGIPETKLDPNMDGVWTDAERMAWAKYRAQFVAQDVVKIATAGFLRGDDKETILADIRSKYPNLWEAAGGSLIVTLLGLLGLNRHRNGTRETEVVKKSDVSTPLPPAPPPPPAR